MFPVAEERLQRQLCLPIHAGMSVDEADRVADCVEHELASASSCARS